MRTGTLKGGLLAGGIALLTATWPGAPVHAQAVQGGGNTVVARVGSQVITAAELERRLAGLPGFQLRGFGRTPEEIRRNFLERVLVRDLLLAQAGAAEKLPERPDVQERIRGVLRSMLLGRIRYETSKGSPVTDDEVRAYYEQNASKYHSPARVAVWRILVGSREEATQIIDAMKKDLTAKRWNDLAREKSLDKASSMRGGNLGFVAPDGSTSEPAVRVAPEVMAAVAGVKDGDIVPEPVKDGAQFAVVWRRQSMKPVDRTLEQEAMSIRQILAHAKVDSSVKSLVEKLRREHVSELSPELVDQLDVSSSGDLQPVRRPGTLPASRRPSAAPPAPPMPPVPMPAPAHKH